jgi:hypothetical protein
MKKLKSFNFRHFLRREKSPFMESAMISNRFTSKPGSSWFLISIDWWMKWESTCSASIINSQELKTKKNSVNKSNKTDNKYIQILLVCSFSIQCFLLY